MQVGLLMGHTNYAQSRERFESKQVNHCECYHDGGFQGNLLEHVFNLETLFPAQLREESPPTCSHFPLKKIQHDLWELDGACVASPLGSSVPSRWARNFSSLQWHHGPRGGALSYGVHVLWNEPSNSLTLFPVIPMLAAVAPVKLVAVASFWVIYLDILSRFNIVYRYQ